MMERGEIRAGIINSQHINSYPLCLALCICKMGIIPFTLEGSWWGVNEIMFLKCLAPPWACVGAQQMPAPSDHSPGLTLHSSLFPVRTMILVNICYLVD